MNTIDKQEILEQQKRLIDKIKNQSEELKLVIDKITSYVYNNFALFRCEKCSDFNYVISEINQLSDSVLLICRRYSCLRKVWVKLKNSNFIVKELKYAYNQQKKLSDLLEKSNYEFGQLLNKYHGEYNPRKGTDRDNHFKKSGISNYDDVSLLILNDSSLVNTKPNIDGRTSNLNIP